MKFTVKSLSANTKTHACLMVGIYEDGSFTPAAKTLDETLNGHISQLIKQKIFSGKKGQTLPLFQDGFNILLVGFGDAVKVDAGVFRRTVACAMKAVLSINMTAAHSFLTEVNVQNKDHAWKTKQIVEVSIENTYQFDQFKSEKDAKFLLEDFSIALSHDADANLAEAALAQGLAIASGMIYTKDLANLPSNICTPSYLADAATELADAYENVSVNILNEEEMLDLSMGALLGVAQGSAEEAKLICIEYRSGVSDAAPVALVGKGITFDTGGNSLKPADAMVGMKYDMCGAATVLGVIKAAAELKLAQNIIGIIPAVENMPGGTAYKPEDILTSMAGITIEVISTDAEGRLILADALTYAKRYQPDVVIDIATLTGAVVIALGHQTTGLLSNHDGLAEDLLAAGQESYDRAWRLPLFDEYQDQIKSPFADIANTGGRSAGTITAACFLSRFTKDYRWAHLDVAGTAAMMSGTEGRLATGRPVPMLMQYLINRTKTA